MTMKHQGNRVAMSRHGALAACVLAAVVVVGCVRVRHPAARPTPLPPGASVWTDPGNIQRKDLFHGPWGVEFAPDPKAIYTFVEGKHDGVNPGMTVRDPQGREWSVKQLTPGGLDREAPVEVTLSRLFSAIGYHQPPVYYLPRFTLKDDLGRISVVGGRFRLKHDALKDAGNWKWPENPFIGSRPYNGLLVLMLMFNSTDLKDSNNSVYERKVGNRVELWYMVRDLGSSLGDTRRLGPYKDDPDAFDKQPFITGVEKNHVQFAYTGYYERYVRDVITPDDVLWITGMLGRLSDQQWHDAFRAGGYDPQTANRFIKRIREKVSEGQALRRYARSS